MGDETTPTTTPEPNGVTVTVPKIVVRDSEMYFFEKWMVTGGGVPKLGPDGRESNILERVQVDRREPDSVYVEAKYEDDPIDWSDLEIYVEGFTVIWEGFLDWRLNTGEYSCNRRGGGYVCNRGPARYDFMEMREKQVRDRKIYVPTFGRPKQQYVLYFANIINIYWDRDKEVYYVGHETGAPVPWLVSIICMHDSLGGGHSVGASRKDLADLGEDCPRLEFPPETTDFEFFMLTFFGNLSGVAEYKYYGNESAPNNVGTATLIKRRDCPTTTT